MDQSSRRRAVVLGVCFCALFLALLVRLYALQILDHDNQLGKRQAQSTGVLTLSLPRGEIYDRNDQVLALSVPGESVWANPQAIDDTRAAAKLLAGALGLREGELIERLSREQLKFTWIKRRVTAAEADAVRKLSEQPPFKPGRKSPEKKLGLMTEYKRQYPQGPLLSHVIGFQSGDEGRDEGMEAWLASMLTPAQTSFAVAKDGKRQMLGAASIDLQETRAHLTVDVLLQKIVEEELQQAYAEHRPKSAIAIVMNPRTGEILALANWPAYDPNSPGAAPPGARLNLAIAAPYEPGSTLKPFLAAFALDLGLVRPETRFDCEMGLWKHGPRTLHDHDTYSTLTLAEVIIKSSNIGAAKLGALTLGRTRLYECMKRFGFGERTGIDMPAEDDGRLFPLSRWTVYTDTSVPIGHEVSVTALQLVAAMSAIANGGTLYRPYIVRRVATSDGTLLVDNGPQAVRRVIGERAAKQMVEILEGVVKEGTGKKAQVPGVRMAGKTGTTQKIDPRTHKIEKYISSFVGFAPADDPKLCIAVIVDEPQGAYYGGAVAAPVVGRIVQRGLVYVK